MDDVAAGTGQVPRERMLALTDGVAAIAMTLLVLDVELPRGLEGRELDDALGEVASQVWTFLLSAVVIAVFWRAHHATLRRTERLGSTLFWLNIASLIPFPTSVLEEYAGVPLGPGLYGTVVGIAALLLYAMEVHIERGVPTARRRRVPLPAQAIVFLASVGVALVSPVAALYSRPATVPLAAVTDRLATARARRR